MNKFSKTVVMVTTVIISISMINVQAAPLRYTVTVLDDIGYELAKPRGISNFGEIGGELSPGHHSFFWSNGTTIDIGSLGGSRTVAWDMNRKGQLVGQGYNSGHDWRGFIWDNDSGIRDLGTLSGYPNMVVFGVNDLGSAVGYAYGSDWSKPHGCVLSDGEWTELATLGGIYGSARAINNLGHVVGRTYLSDNQTSRPVLWRDGQIIDLGSIAVRDINDHDQILGQEDDVAVIWQEWHVVELGTLGGSSSTGTRISNSGEVVGTAETTSGESHAFLWEDGVMIDLNNMLADGPDWVLTTATGINDNGWITGRGLLNGVEKAFLLTPVECQEEKLMASDAESNGMFGLRLSIDGTVAIAGAVEPAPYGKLTGLAYIYRHDGTDWVEEATLVTSNGVINDADSFGVAIKGNWAVVGAPGDNEAGTNAGAAYVYSYDGTTWNLLDKLIASDAEAGDRFGRIVHLDGNALIVSAHLDNTDYINDGSAYVFKYNGITWMEVVKLTANDASQQDQFGEDVAISGDVVLIGANWDDPMGEESGSAYVFRATHTAPGVWRQEAKLVAPDGTSNDRFGDAVAVDGDVAVVGAYWDQTSSLRGGSVYVYRFDGDTWNFEAKLIPSDIGPNVRFGQRVAIEGDTIVATAIGNLEAGDTPGAAYVFRYNGAVWEEIEKIAPADGAGGDAFGADVAISGSQVFIGSRWNDEAGVDAGAAYIMCLDDTLVDCNANGIPDREDISLGISSDCQLNGIPDECELCGDLDLDGDVDADDRGMFIDSFGRADGDPLYNACCDYDGDSMVTFADYQQWISCYRDYTAPVTDAVRTNLPSRPDRRTGRDFSSVGAGSVSSHSMLLEKE